MSNEGQGGRGRPPKSGRFRPGQSGNPKGRPPGSKRQAPYELVLGRIVTITEGGVPRKMSARDAFLHALAKRGMEGDVLAGRLADELLSADRERADMLAGAQACTLHIVTVRFGATAMLVALKLAVKHDAYRKTARYRLEPWAIEAALERFGERRLSLAEQKIVWHAARTPQKIQWPEWWEYRG